MGEVTVRLPFVLAQMVDGERRFAVHGETIGEALRDLVRQRPGLGMHFFDDAGALRRHILCFHNELYARGREGLERSREITARGDGRAECGNERRAVHAFAAVRQRCVAPRQICGEVRATGTHPAVDIRTDLRSDPVVPLVGGAEREIETGGAAEAEANVRVREHYLIGGALGSEHHPGRQPADPAAGDVLGRDLGTVLLEQHERQHAVVDVVVWLAAREVAAGALAKAWKRRKGVLDQRHVIAQRQGPGLPEVLGQGRVPPSRRQHFDGLAEQAAGDAALPGGADAGGVDG
jgi:hypothetical protein